MHAMNNGRVRGDGTSWEPVQGLPSGSLTLDVRLGTGGWPRGRIAEVHGPDGSGKTTLLLQAVAQAQRLGGVGAFLDADHATEPATAERLGIDPERTPFLRPGSLEEAFEKMEELVQGGADVIALDSIAALVPADHQGCGRNDLPPAKNEAHQRKIDHLLKALMVQLSGTRTVLLISNQLVEKVGVMFGDPMMTPWETHPLRYYASQRVDLRRMTTVKEGERAVGYTVRAKVLKNRFAAPMVTAEFEVRFDSGAVPEAELLDLGVESRVVAKQGGRYAYGELLLGRSRDLAMQHLRQDGEVAGRLREEIVARLGR